MSTVKAAGSCLTVGELREALGDLPDDVPVLAHGEGLHVCDASIVSVELDAMSGEVLTGKALDAVVTYLREVASRERPCAGARSGARDILDEYGWNEVGPSCDS